MNLMKAAEMALKQHKITDDFADIFPHKMVQQWRWMVEEWQADPSHPNPYVSNEHGMFFLNVFRCHILQLFCQHQNSLRLGSG